MANPVKIKTKGTKQIKKNVSRFKGKMLSNGDKAMAIVALKVKDQAMRNVPVRTGNLRQSAHWSAPKSSDMGEAFEGEEAGKLASERAVIIANEQARINLAKKFNTVLGIIGFSAFYALWVHENPNAGAAGYDPELDTKDKIAKQVHSKVGAYKYLERAMTQTKPKIPKIFAAIMKVK